MVDLSCSVETFVHTDHRRKARKALGSLEVERCTSPLDFLEDWTALYKILIQRHQITGIAAFSSDCFAKQLSVPGMVMFRAMHNDASVAMLLWYEQGERVYYHLGASSQVGYQLGASYALFDYAIKYFASRGFAWLDLGGRAGLENSRESGLSRFKRGWANETKTAWFCGRIFDKEKYREILATGGYQEGRYFPAYRQSDFYRSAIVS